MKKKDKTPLLLKFIRLTFFVLETLTPFLAHRLFIRLFFTPFKYPVPEKEKEAETRSERFTVRIEGDKKIQCYSWGSGPPVLCIHGWAGRGTQFRRFIEPLNEAGYKVVAFDGPAHGNSDGKRTDIMEFHSAVMEIQKIVGVPHAIIAHSFGGAVSLYSVMKGIPVNTIITISSPTIGNDIINTYLRAVGASASTGEFFKSYVLQKTGKPFDEFTSVYFIRHVPQHLNLLIVHDKDDREAPVHQALELKRIFPRAELSLTEGLGHTRILKDDHVIRQTVTFITRHSSV